MTGSWRGCFAVTAVHRTGELRHFLGSCLDGPVLESAIARRPDRWQHAATGALASYVFLGVIVAVVLLISG